MSDVEPGLDLHAWETRWSELEEALEEDPRAALPDACDAVEDLVGAVANLRAIRSAVGAGGLG